MTKKYRVKISQLIDVEIDNDTKNKSDRQLIKEILKSDPPFLETTGIGDEGWSNIKTSDRIKVLKVKKVGEYKTCPKCKGEGDIEVEIRYWNGTAIEVEECPRCGGRGEVIKRRR